MEPEWNLVQSPADEKKWIGLDNSLQKSFCLRGNSMYKVSDVRYEMVVEKITEIEMLLCSGSEMCQGLEMVFQT